MNVITQLLICVRTMVDVLIPLEVMNVNARLVSQEKIAVLILMIVKKNHVKMDDVLMELQVIVATAILGSQELSESFIWLSLSI